MAKIEHGRGSHEQFGSEQKKKKKKSQKTQMDEPKTTKSLKTQGDESAQSFQLDDGGEASELANMKRESLHNAQDNDRKQKKKKEKKKKTKQNGEVGRDRNCNDDGINSVYVSDEEDMLFNFSMPYECADSFNHDTEKQEMIIMDKNHTIRKKKKRTREEEEQHVLYHEETDVNCSTQQNKKLLDEVSNKRLQLNEVKNIEKTEVLNILRNSKCSSGPSIRPTLTMAVAGSIVDNAQSFQLAIMLAGQIARAAAIFRVDEIVVFDDYDVADVSSYMQNESEEAGGLFMVRVLKYLEVPQYLRKALVPMHRSLYSVGKLPPLDAPHHLRKHEWRPFREGVVLDKSPLSSSGSYVDVGLDKDVQVKQSLKPGTRVTVAMGQHKSEGDVLQVVDREAARQGGFYWGYTVRYANCLSAVFDECPFEGKYDFCIGTSEHGVKLKPTDLVIPKCKHLLVAFGGLGGLEESFELDKKLKKCSIRSVFDLYLNTCPNQGSRTIRTEEAILISLQYLQAAVQEALRTP